MGSYISSLGKWEPYSNHKKQRRRVRRSKRICNCCGMPGGMPGTHTIQKEGLCGYIPEGRRYIPEGRRRYIPEGRYTPEPKRKSRCNTFWSIPTYKLQRRRSYMFPRTMNSDFAFGAVGQCMGFNGRDGMVPPRFMYGKKSKKRSANPMARKAMKYYQKHKHQGVSLADAWDHVRGNKFGLSDDLVSYGSQVGNPEDDNPGDDNPGESEREYDFGFSKNSCGEVSRPRLT